MPAFSAAPPRHALARSDNAAEHHIFSVSADAGGVSSVQSVAVAAANRLDVGRGCWAVRGRIGVAGCGGNEAHFARTASCGDYRPPTAELSGGG
jgi:hypothetical protein